MGKWYKVTEKLPEISPERYNEGYDTRGVPAHLTDGSLVIAWFCVEDQRFYDSWHAILRIDITDRIAYWFDLPEQKEV